jgi:hypothetical protein
LSVEKTGFSLKYGKKYKQVNHSISICLHLSPSSLKGSVPFLHDLSAYDLHT